MKFKVLAVLLLAGFFSLAASQETQAQERLISRGTSARVYDGQDWARFQYYPYFYYPQNFTPLSNYRSSNDLYYRYGRNMQVPMYNPYWQNYYPVPRRFHEGKHFLLDVF